MPLLEVQNLDVGYGEIQVLRDLSIHLNANERVGLFGPNGHGKTTLLRTISGLLTPWAGDVTFDGNAIGGLAPKRLVDQGIVHVAQGSTLFPRMTVLENLRVGAYAKRVWGNRNANLEKAFTLFPRLAERQNQLVQTLSGGERQMVAIGIGLMGEARVLMLDEPTLGLAPRLKEELGEAIGQIAQSGVPMILVEQDVEFLLDLTDRLYLIEEGRVVMEKDTSSGGLVQEELMAMYFGGSDSDAVQKVVG